ncbi:uroporphyrinogen-III C-methyltransferase [bacterium]|nr:uroporphyrinogen-III C-methyltransferase [bacterium]
MNRPQGFVSLVGAGPGDPRLITLAGLRAIERADVIIYDLLVNPSLLDDAPAHAERIFVGKQGGGKYTPQPEINELLLDKARQGKRVVRLKGGDPLVFARGAEELEALAGAGIDFEIIPGVTAALAAAATAAIPLTHRHESSTLILVTGHEDPDKEASVDWHQLATLPGTLAIYMARTKLGSIAAELLEGGRDPKTPVAFVQWAGSNRQVSHVTTLFDATKGVPDHVGTPMLAIVGRVVAHRQELAWFESRPLFGQTVLLLRPAEQNARLAQQLEDAGAVVIVEPTMRVEEIEPPSNLDDAIDAISEFDAIVFVSRPGVRHFCERAWKRGQDARSLAGLQLVAVGPGTAEEMALFNLHADLVPEDHRAEGLADALSPSAQGKRFLVIRANRGRDLLEQSLRSAGGFVRSVPAYQQVDVIEPSALTRSQLQAGRIDWIFLTSSNVATNFFRWLDEETRARVGSVIKLISISPITSQTVRSAGFEVAIEATTHTPEGMMEKLLERLRSG